MTSSIDVLYLKPPHREQGAGGSADELLAELKDTLAQLRQALHAILLDSRSNRKEARQWLINAIAALDLQDPATKRRRFAQFLPGGGACRGAEHASLAQAALQLLFEAAPGEVGALVAQDAPLLRRFFKSEPKRAPLWFGHFSMEGLRRFKYGAAALAQYALGHRAEMWQLLAWQGRHPQAPVAVAQRPHYFSELDVPRTIRHLLRDCPDFWSSREMRQSVEAGAAQLLGLDPGWWSKELLRWLEDRGSSSGDRLYALLCRHLEAGPWRQHCQRLLQLLPQQDLLPFAVDLLGGSRFPDSSSGIGSSGGGSSRDAPAAAAAAANAGEGAGGAAAAAAAGPAQPGAWLVFRRARWASLESLLLAAALGCSLPLLLRLLRDDELADERRQVDQLVLHMLRAGPGHSPDELRAVTAAHWHLRRQLAQQRTAAADAELQEALLLHLFAAAFLVQQLASSGSEQDAHQLQQLLAASGFPCKLLNAGGGGDAGRRRSGSSRRHKRHKRRHSGSSKRHNKKRRRRSSSEEESDSSSDGSGSDDDAGFLLPWSGSTGEGPQHMWRLQHAGGGGGAAAATDVSSLELVDAVINATAWAHARWLFGSR